MVSFHFQRACVSNEPAPCKVLDTIARCSSRNKNSSAPSFGRCVYSSGCTPLILSVFRGEVLRCACLSRVKRSILCLTTHFHDTRSCRCIARTSLSVTKPDVYVGKLIDGTRSRPLRNHAHVDTEIRKTANFPHPCRWYFSAAGKFQTHRPNVSTLYKNGC